MTALSQHILLEAWERAEARPPLERSTILLAAAKGAAPAAETECELLPVGQRDAELLRLREQFFGPKLHAVAECAECQTAVEFSLASGELQLPLASHQGPYELTQEGLTLNFRLPHSVDLAIAAGESDVPGARRRLFARCLLAATGPGGVQVAPEEVPDEVVRAVGERMREADPQADVVIALHCPQCGAGWEAPFDVGTFFWQELQVWARRLLREVHELASAYGWSETAILNMSAARRHAYLEQIRA